MSWAEIKKAVNSNIDVPLNELIYKKGLTIITAMEGQNHVSTEITPITITGKGLLLSAIAGWAPRTHDLYASKSRVKVEVDGETIVNGTAESTVDYEQNVFAGVHSLLLDELVFNPYHENESGYKDAGYVFTETSMTFLAGQIPKTLDIRYSNTNSMGLFIYDPNFEFSIAQSNRYVCKCGMYNLGVIPFKNSVSIKYTAMQYTGGTTNYNRAKFHIVYIPLE